MQDEKIRSELAEDEIKGEIIRYENTGISFGGKKVISGFSLRVLKGKKSVRDLLDEIFSYRPNREKHLRN